MMDERGRLWVRQRELLGAADICRHGKASWVCDPCDPFRIVEPVWQPDVPRFDRPAPRPVPGDHLRLVARQERRQERCAVWFTGMAMAWRAVRDSVRYAFAAPFVAVWFTVAWLFWFVWK